MGPGGAPADARDRLVDPALPGFGALASRSLLYATGGVAQKLVAVLLVPLLARVLSTTEFGRLEVLSTTASTLTGIAVLGVDVVITRRWVDLDDEGRRRAFGSWLAIALAVGSATVLVLGLLAGPVSRWLFDDEGSAWGIRWAALFALFNLLNVVGLTALRNQDRARLYAAASIVTVLSNAAIVAGLVVSSPDETAVMVGITAAAAIGAGITITATRHLLFNPPAWAEALALLRRSVPLVPGVALTLGGDLVNRLLLLAAAGETDVGYLSIALRFTGVGVLVLTGFQLAWQPRAYALAPRAGGVERLARDGTTMLVVVATLTVALAASSPALLHVLGGDDYADALPTVGFALLFPLGMTLLVVATMPSAISNRMGDLGTATGIAAAVSLALTAAASRPFGAPGAAAALAGGQLVGAAAGVLLVRRSGAPPLPHRASGVALAALAAVIAMVSTLPAGGTSVELRLALVAAFAAGLLLWERPVVRSAVRLVAQLPQRR